MALQKGFPPSNLISPSVRIAEKDLSFIAPEQTGHRAGLVGFASKGPINTPVLINTSRQLHITFGIPHPDVGDPFLLYAAEQYLLIGNELFVVRVADTSTTSGEQATTASVDIPSAGGPAAIEGNIPVGAGWSFDDNQFFRWRLNGILASKVLVVLEDDNRPSPDTGLPYAADELVDALNAQLTDEDGIEFYYTEEDSNGDPTASSNLGVRTTFSYGTSATLEIVSVTDSLYGPTSVVGMGISMTPASITGDATQYPESSISTPGVFDFSAFAADSINLQIVIDGTDNVLIDNVVQTVIITSASQTIGDIADEINQQVDDGDVPGGFVASAPYDSLILTTNHVGRDAKLLVKPTSTGADLLGLDSDTHIGTSPSCVTLSGSTYTCGIVTGSANSSGFNTFTITADSPGIDGNDINVVITNSITEGTFTIDVYSVQGALTSQVETWGRLSKDPTSGFYVESYIATVSDFIRVVDNTDILALPEESTLVSPYVLTGGSDGIPSDPDQQDLLLLGDNITMTGLQALSDPEQIDLDLIAIPGHTSTAIALGLIDFCVNKRQDCFSVIDPPFGLTVKEIIQWQNGVHPLNGTRFDSDFAALYWPWVQIRDGFNRVNVWVPPSGTVLATYARSDSLSAPWFAPAGLNRGLAPNVLDVFTRPSLEDRDSMYGNRNAVNPIIQFADLDGFFIFGQKTLQRRPTALDRVNVRRMMLFVEKEIRREARNLLFEPHDEALRQQFIQMATRILERVQLGRGITAFIIKCDTEINTPDVIDRNELRARIGIQPTRAAEFIFIEFSIHRTGSFAENADTF